MIDIREKILTWKKDNEDYAIVGGLAFNLEPAGKTDKGVPRLSLLFQKMKKMQGSLPRALAEQLALEITGGKDKSRKTAYFLETILFNCNAAALIQDELGSQARIIVKYSRNDHHWKAIERYGDLSSKDRMLEIVAGLEKADLIHHQLGFRKPNGYGRRSFFYPTEKLCQLLAEHRADSPIVSTSNETIILKDSEKNPIDYREKDCPDASGKRQLIKDLLDLWTNHILSSPSLSDTNGNTYIVNVTALLDDLHFVYNEDFKSGGRLYCSIQNRPSATRKDWKIDEEPTICLDYKGLHPSMLYDQIIEAGETTGHLLWKPYDPYQGIKLPSFSGTQAELRKLLKRAFSAALNAKIDDKTRQAIQSKANKKKLALRGATVKEMLDAATDEKARKAIQSDANRGKLDLKDATAAELLDAIKASHPMIKDHFGSGVGIRLQNKDAELACRVIRYMLALEIPTVPIHDGFVAPASKKLQLKCAMVSAYNEAFGVLPEVEVD